MRKVITKRGEAKKIAEHFGVSEATVSKALNFMGKGNLLSHRIRSYALNSCGGFYVNTR